jgi:hypothetical protein
MYYCNRCLQPLSLLLLLVYCLKLANKLRRAASQAGRVCSQGYKHRKTIGCRGSAHRPIVATVRVEHRRLVQFNFSHCHTLRALSGEYAGDFQRQNDRPRRALSFVTPLCGADDDQRAGSSLGALLYIYISRLSLASFPFPKIYSVRFK